MFIKECKTNSYSQATLNPMRGVSVLYSFVWNADNNCSDDDI